MNYVGISLVVLGALLFGFGTLVMAYLRRERFYKIEHDGTYCIMEQWDQEAFPADEYNVSIIRMTRRKFNELPEFEGF